MATNDGQIREALMAALVCRLEKYRKKTGHPTRIIQELGLCNGKNRVDIATVNGILHGYEIKSDLDTLERLPRQLEEYDKVFDKMTLVVGEKHIISALEIIPDWWGVELAKIDVNGVVNFSEIREASKNPSQESRAIAKLLWRQEALALLSKSNNEKITGRSSREKIYGHLIELFSRDELLEVVRTILISRQDWKAGSSQM